METLWQDIRYGMRMILKSPSLSLVAIVALALGIGANTAIFSVVNAVLLRPLPFANADQLMMVWETAPSRGKSRQCLLSQFCRLARAKHVFEHVASYYSDDFSYRTRRLGPATWRSGQR